jgi:hypothetical protein
MRFAPQATPAPGAAPFENSRKPGGLRSEPRSAAGWLPGGKNHLHDHPVMEAVRREDSAAKHGSLERRPGD